VDRHTLDNEQVERSFSRLNDQASFKFEEEKSMRLPKNAEELVVPAHNLKKPIDFNTVTEEAFQGGDQ